MTDIDLIEAKRIVIETFCGGLDVEQRRRCIEFYQGWVLKDNENLKSTVRYIPAGSHSSLRSHGNLHKFRIAGIPRFSKNA
jgi:hypothetical protein